MSLDHRLLSLLVCPICKGPLEAGHGDDGRLLELRCPADRLAYPVRDGIPVMLEDEARSLVEPPSVQPFPPPP
jgi:uncharacterized protein YbaR (Trm112 family)